MQTHILVGILSVLLTRDEAVTAKQIAERYEISTRSVYRYIDALALAGIPLVGRPGRKGGWGIDADYKMKAMFFTKEEYARMIFAVQTVSVQDSVTRSLCDKLHTLERSVKDAVVLRSDQLIVDTSAEAEERERLDKLQRAVERHRVCEIEYHSKEGEVTQRTVEPYCLVLKDGVWYIYCYCRLRDDFRYFKVNRIAKLVLFDDKFLPRPFSANTAAIGEAFSKGKENAEIILTVKKDALTAVEEWLGLGKVAKIGDEYIAKASLPYDELLISRILSFGKGVVVEKPAELREEVTRLCTLVLRNYE